MTPSETALLLALAAAYDRRTVGEADVYAWHDVLEHVPLETGKDAVRHHYATSTRFLMPADVNAYAERVREMDELAARRRRQIEAPRIERTPVEGKYGQRKISDPSPAFSEASKVLADLRARQVAAQETGESA